MDLAINNFTKGMTISVDNPFLLDGLRLLDNCLISYKIGTITKDLGYFKIGGTIQASKAITGLHNFRQTAATQKILATINDATDDDTQLFYNNAGTWTEITDAETAWANKANIAVEMEDFIGYCFFVGYGATDGFLPVASLTGTTFSTSTNVTDMPQGKFIKRYRDRLYVANLYDGGALPYRVGFSDQPSSGGTIGWIDYQADIGWFNVDYSEAITGLGENWDRLIVFTTFSAYMYDQSSIKKVWEIGCSNHRTIKNSGAYMFWANRDGVWYSTGGRPANIAGRVIDFIRNATDPTAFFAEVIDEEYWLYVGDVSVDGFAFNNTALIYNIPTDTWRVREFYDDIKTFAAFLQSGKLRLYMGDDSGMVWDKSKYEDTTQYYTDAACEDEKITNGAFAANITGWTDNSTPPDIIEWSASYGGSMKMTGASAYAKADQTITTIKGNTYNVSIEVKSIAGGGGNLYVGTTQGAYNLANLSIPSVGVFTTTFVATGTTTYIRITTGWNDFYVDNISIVDTQGQPIAAQFETNPIFLGAPDIEKVLVKGTFFANRAQGLKMKARLLDKNSRSLTPYKSLAEINYMITAKEMPLLQEGVFLQIEGVENSPHPYWSFWGMNFKVQGVREASIKK